MTYAITDKTLPLALPYGEANLHTGNGKLTRYWRDIVGNELQVKFQLAIGLGIIHAVKKVTYDGQDIPSQNYIFHKGEPNETAADAIFPNDPNHQGASFINILLPVGMNVDNQPDKAVVQIEGRETANYNAAGSQTGFGYSTDPARAIADAVKVINGDVSKIDFVAWAEYQAWCNELITITKNGQSVQVPRWGFRQFFIPPFNTKLILDRACEMTCSDWQEANGKIILIPAKPNRLITFNFDVEVAKDLMAFEFEALQGDRLYNGIQGNWRDRDDPLLREMTDDPIIVDRRNSEFEPKNFYEFNLSVCYRDEGERICNYLAKSTIDCKDYCSMRGSYASYHVLPGDLVTFSHPVPAWDDVRCKVIKKDEKEDRESVEGTEEGAGYKFYLRREPVELYSDTDHAPIITRTPATTLNPYAAPPIPSMIFAQADYTGRNGQIEKQLIITITFGAFASGQRGRVLWMKPGGSYQDLQDVAPGSNNQAVVIVPNAPVGDNYFKVIAYNTKYYTQQTGMNDALIVVGGVNTEKETPEIEQTGVSTEENVVIGVKGYTEKMRFRKIETANNSLFTAGYASVTKDYHDVINNNNAALERIDYTNAETKYVRVSHSSNNIDYSPVSDYLQIHFFNESNDGVPELIQNISDEGIGQFAVVGNSFKVLLPAAIKNGYDATTVQYRVLDATNAKTVVGTVLPGATSLTLNDVTGFPDNGKLYAFSGEILAFQSRSGGTLNGLLRGLDGSAPSTLNDGSLVYLVIDEGTPDSSEIFYPRTDKDLIFHYRRRNGYRGDGSDGWSAWYIAGQGLGEISQPVPPEPTPPPAVEPDPAVLYPGYEDPSDYANFKRDNFERRGLITL